jgi:hypothetical protein
VSVVIAQPVLELLDVQQVAHPQQQLDSVKRLCEKIAGPRRKDPPFGFIRSIGGKHQEGNVAPVARQRGKPGDELKPVDPRHMQIEQHQVRSSFDEHPHYLGRIGGDLHARVAIPLQDPPQQQQIGPLVVDREDPRVPEPLIVGLNWCSHRRPAIPLRS